MTYSHFLSFHVCGAIEKPSFTVNEFRKVIPKDFIELNMRSQSLPDAFLDQCTGLYNSARGVFKGNSVGSTSNILEVE